MRKLKTGVITEATSDENISIEKHNRCVLKPDIVKFL